MRDIVKADPDHQINIQDIKHWETVNGKIPPDSIVLLNTGYGSYWDNYRRYTGMTPTAKDSAENFHFPGLDPQAAEWLISQRKVKAIGIDTFSIDYGQTQNYATHQILTKNDIPIFENISSMTKLPPRHFKIYAFPMKIKGGTGAPLRIVAEVYQ